MVTPRYFAAEALSSSTLCKMYLVFKGLTFLAMWRTLHLEGLNCFRAYEVSRKIQVTLSN